MLWYKMDSRPHNRNSNRDPLGGLGLGGLEREASGPGRPSFDVSGALTPQHGQVRGCHVSERRLVKVATGGK